MTGLGTHFDDLATSPSTDGVSVGVDEAYQLTARRLEAAGISSNLLQVLHMDANQLQDLDTEQRKRALQLKLEALRRLAPHSLLAHAQLCHRDDANKPIVAAAHHAEWARIGEDEQRYPFVVTVAPPGFAKSTWFTWILPSWELGRKKGRPRIGITCNSAGQATTWALSIAGTVESQAFQATYPEVRPDKKRGWSRGHFFVSGAPEGPNPSVLSTGMGGVSVLGKRLDFILLDDPTTWENARSKTVMEGQRHFLKTTLLTRFPPGMGPPAPTVPGGRMVCVCTRWATDDLVETLKEFGFTVVRMPALGYWDGMGDPATDDFVPGTQPLWPERVTTESLEKMREDMGEIVFELVMQGNVKILSGDVFDPAWFQYAPPPPREQFERVTQFVDTAGGRDREKGDYFVVATIGRYREQEGAQPKFWVLHIHRERVGSLRQFDLVRREAMIWDPDVVVVEDMNEGKALYDRLVAETSLPMHKYKPVKDKEFRAIPIAGKYRAGLVFHPCAPRASEDEPLVVEKWVRAYEGELQAFPNSEFDDQVDAAAGAFNHMEVRKGARLRVLA